MVFVCNIDACGRQFRRRYDLRRHQNHFHIQNANLVEKCFFCGQLFNTCDELQHHYRQAHPPNRKFVVKEKAFRDNFITYRYNYLPDINSIDDAQNSIRRLIHSQILNETAQKMICKVSLIIIAEMSMIDHQGERISVASIPFRAPGFYANSTFRRNIDSNIRKSFIHQQNTLDQWMRGGSNWQFNRALAFDVEFSSINPVRGGCDTDINIKQFQNKTNLFNPQNTNNKCFLYCIAYFILFAGLTKKITPQDNLKIKRETQTFNIKGIKFPLDPNDIAKFLNRNKKLDLKINLLYRGTDDKVYPMEYGLGDGGKTVNLLLIETNMGGHYMAIKNTDNYLKKVYNLGTGKKASYLKAFFCLNCLNSFSSARVRDEHSLICAVNKPRIEVCPDNQKNIVKFKNFDRQHMLEYVAYLDFECVLPDKRTDCTECRSLKCKCDASYVQDINHQIPICYSFVIIGPSDEIIHEQTYAGPEAHIHFVRHILDQEKAWIKSLVIDSKEVILMTNAEKEAYDNAKNCYMCGISFIDSGITKCRDHSHYSSRYLGAACQQCNLRRQKPKKLKIITHNCSKYDMHFIVKALSSFKDEIEGIEVLPYNGENFRTLSFNIFEFIDSLAFLQASLAQLSSDLKESDNKYAILRQTYLVKKGGRFNKKRFAMVLEKSFFPYEYCKSLELMEKTTKIPKQKDFYSTLSEDSISRENHQFAKMVWLEYQCKNLLDYTKLYCKIDTILLAEIFQAFRKKMHSFSGLDPAYYISLPAYGYDSMLKITGSEIELPTDINMVHFLEQGKRGGVSFINTRYLNNLQFEDAGIEYLDRNNLYGESQLQKLPLSDFRWLSESEINQFDLDQDFLAEHGYFVECDLHYPEHLHKLHSNLPLAPEVLEISFNNLSPFVKNAMLNTDGTKNYRDTKLMSTFHDKTNYVTHIRNLKLYLSLGLELKKIHKILEFKQDFIFAKYIEKTTEARQKGKSKFEMDLFKKLVIIFKVLFIF